MKVSNENREIEDIKVNRQMKVSEIKVSKEKRENNGNKRKQRK